MHFATNSIKEELQYLTREYLRHNSTKEVSDELLWILNRITSQFCMNFFMAWLNIAEKGSRNQSVPSWKEISLMIQSSFSKFTFKYKLKDYKVEFEYYIQQIKQSISIPIYECPNRSISRKRRINRMRSYIPSEIVMDLIDNPSQENKQFSIYVKQYVSKLKF